MADEETTQEQAGAESEVGVADAASEDADGALAGAGGADAVGAADEAPAETETAAGESTSGDAEGTPESADAQGPKPGSTEVSPADLPDLRQGPGAGGGGGNIDMVLDVSVPIMVELGRTRMLIRDILDLEVGGVVELDKAAGQPVEVYVRDMKFASGEVVVVGDRFGVRIKEIFDPRADRDK